MSQILVTTQSLSREERTISGLTQPCNKLRCPVEALMPGASWGALPARSRLLFPLNAVNDSSSCGIGNLGESRRSSSSWAPCRRAQLSMDDQPLISDSSWTGGKRLWRVWCLVQRILRCSALTISSRVIIMEVDDYERGSRQVPGFLCAGYSSVGWFT